MRYTRLFVTVFICGILGFINCYGQLQYISTQYKIEDGVPQQTINRIIKDKEGYMWFATWNGVCRFDGHSFVTYRSLPGDSNDLTTNRIQYIRVDANNNLWILDDQKNIYRFYPESNKFQRFMPQTAPIGEIFTLSDGDTWLSQIDGSLLRVNIDGEKMNCQQILDSSSGIRNVITLVHEKDIIWIIADKGIYKFCKKSNKLTPQLFSESSFYCFRKWMNKFVIGSDKGQLYVYDPQANTCSIVKFNTANKLKRIRPYDTKHLMVIAENDGFFLTDGCQNEGTHYTTSNKLLSNQINAIYDDENQKHIWLAYENTAKITRIDPFSSYHKHYQLKEQESNNLNRHISQDSYGRLWICTKEDCLNYYDEKLDDFLPFSVSRINCESKYMKAKRVLFDDQSNLWISKHPKGLVKVSFKKDLFTLLAPTVNEYTAIDNELRCVMRDVDHNIWVGTQNGDIQLYDANKNFIGFLNSTGKLSQRAENFGPVYALLQDKEGCIWIGTHNDGLMKLTPQNKLTYQIKYFKENPTSTFALNSNTVTSLKEDRKGRILIGTLGRGLNYIEKDENGNERFIHSGNKLLDYPSRFSGIRNICVDHQNNIWLATTSGILLCKWEKDGLAYTPIVKDSNVKNSLSCDNVSDIFQSSKKEIFVATFGGGIDKLTGFSKQNNGIFRNYSTSGMLSNVPFTLSEDQEGNLWIPSEDGLYRLFTQNDSTEIYDNRFLPEEIMFTECRAFRLSDNEILFGTDKGLLSLNPLKMKRDTYTSNLIIADIHVNGKETRSLMSSTGIVLSHKEKSFSIDYEALDMKFPNNIEYAYRLEGFDDWNYVKNNRKAVYTNIPKGKYVFQVKSTNSDGVWSDKISELPITVLPSFWESIYGIILYILVFVLVVAISTYILFIFYKLRNRVSVEKEILNIKTKFFTDIIHELRTPFTLIVAPIDHMLVQKDISPVIQQDLSLVKRNVKHTLKIINQVLDLQKIQKESRLTVQRIKIEPFIEHIIDNFRSIAIQRESEIIFQAENSPIFLWADPDKLESILFNLITNAFKYSPKGTVVKLSAQETETKIILQISDQGYGISQERQKNVFNRFENYISSDIFKQQSTGIGLSLVKEQVELHKGTISLQSRVNEGSTFTLTFCKGKEHFATGTEFILTDYDEQLQSYKEEGLFLKEIYETEEGDKDGDKNTILVVDDNKELLSFLYTILSEEFRVITASNGKEGLEKAIKYLPNMIVSDVVMPEMAGTEMVKKLQSNTSTCHIPIVLLSSKADVQNQNEGLELGVDDYITKPFSASYLVTKIWSIIKQRKRIQALYYSQLIKNSDEDSMDSEEKEKLQLLPKADKDLLDRIVSFIEERLDSPDLTIDALVDEAGISRSALFKKMKTLIGIPPMDLIKNIRLKKAAEFIKEGSDNFTQIAYRTGFSDSQYFSKCFKQTYGVTPTEYKKNQSAL